MRRRETTGSVELTIRTSKAIRELQEGQQQLREETSGLREETSRLWCTFNAKHTRFPVVFLVFLVGFIINILVFYNHDAVAI